MTQKESINLPRRADRIACGPVEYPGRQSHLVALRSFHAVNDVRVLLGQPAHACTRVQQIRAAGLSPHPCDTYHTSGFGRYVSPGFLLPRASTAASHTPHGPRHPLPQHLKAIGAQELQGPDSPHVPNTQGHQSSQAIRAPRHRAHQSFGAVWSEGLVAFVVVVMISHRRTGSGRADLPGSIRLDARARPGMMVSGGDTTGMRPA